MQNWLVLFHWKHTQQWKQFPCLESNHALKLAYRLWFASLWWPFIDLSCQVAAEGYWGLLRAMATFPLPPTNDASIFPSAPPVPSMQFAKDLLLVKEKEGVLQVPIIRSGDLSYESSVRCYTQSHSAQVMEDFEERRNADSSRITFLKGEKVSGFMIAERSDSLFPWCLYLSIMKSVWQILIILWILLLVDTFCNTIICPMWLSSLYPTYNQINTYIIGWTRNLNDI